MRKNYCILLAILLLILCGCGQTQYTTVYISQGMYSASAESEQWDADPEVVLMKTYGEYQQFLSKIDMTKSGRWLTRHAAKLSSFERNYFRQNMLVYIYFHMNDSSHRVSLSDVQYADSILQIEVQKWKNSEAGHDDIGSYGVLLELPRNEEVSSVEFTVKEETPESTQESEGFLWFERISSVGELSYAEMAERLNEAGNGHVTARLIMNNCYHESVEIPADSSEKEKSELLKRYCDEVTAYYSAKNQEMLAELDTSGLAATFRIDIYSSDIYAEFENGISEKEIELLHTLLEHENVYEIVVQPNAEAVAVEKMNEERAANRALFMGGCIGAAVIAAAGVTFAVVKKQKSGG